MLCSLCIWLEKKLKLLTSFPELQRGGTRNTRRLLENHFIIMIVLEETEAHGKLHKSPCTSNWSHLLHPQAGLQRGNNWIPGICSSTWPLGWKMVERKNKRTSCNTEQSSMTEFYTERNPKYLLALSLCKHSPVPYREKSINIDNVH